MHATSSRSSTPLTPLSRADRQPIAAQTPLKSRRGGPWPGSAVLVGAPGVHASPASLRRCAAPAARTRPGPSRGRLEEVQSAGCTRRLRRSLDQRAQHADSEWRRRSSGQPSCPKGGAKGHHPVQDRAPLGVAVGAAGHPASAGCVRAGAAARAALPPSPAVHPQATSWRPPPPPCIDSLLEADARRAGGAWRGLYAVGTGQKGCKRRVRAGRQDDSPAPHGH